MAPATGPLDPPLQDPGLLQLAPLTPERTMGLADLVVDPHCSLRLLLPSSSSFLLLPKCQTSIMALRALPSPHPQ